MTVAPEREQNLLGEGAMRDVRRTIVGLTGAQERLAYRVGSTEDRLTHIEQGLAQAARCLREAADLVESLLDSGERAQDAGESARNTE